MSTFKASYSKLRIHLVCPLQYKYLYIDGLWEMKKPRPHLSMGESVHRALGAFYKITDPEQRTLPILQKMLRAHWQRRGYKDENEERQWGIKALDMLGRYFDRMDPLAKPALIEEGFQVPFGDLKLTGRIDRADRLEDGTYELIDYKTGNPSQERDLQIACYTLGIQLKHKFDVTKFSYHMLAVDRAITVSVTPDSVASGLRRIKEIVDAIRNTERFQPTPNELCGWCDFTELCPVYESMGSGAEEPNWEQGNGELDCGP
ncbi:hypothetical protein AMJ40_03105 [candidate division TA06 bacterium DG_26]|uniref:PD-(D/E)XK endonuclease-like domain-containing protein n=1 Tax=candidate division TA06 bacterium DG_26 TaxID=1703771 RepID=A0A0S7WJM6_UNCT6|nr:MAG: hypothetical protein AMJ40_03105 [candidate division TA06 bacterium DG_26]